MKVKENDFVKLDYTGSVDTIVFDTTEMDIAKHNKLFKESIIYEPVTIVVGAGHLLKGLEKHIIGKDEKETFEVSLQPEEGFGKKNQKLIQIMPERVFKEHKMNVYPGLQVNMDGIIGLIKSVSSGRVIVDFNHPLAGKVLTYKVKLHGIINNDLEKVESIFSVYTGLTKKDFTVKTEGNVAFVEYKHNPKVTEKAKEVIAEDVKKYISTKEIKFVEIQSKK